jgi:molybdate transport system substrate-binding protein
MTKWKRFEGVDQVKRSGSTFGYLVASAAVPLLLLMQSAAVDAAEIKVLCTNAFRAVMLELKPEFERTTGHKLSIDFMGTNLKPTIEKGEQFDVAMSQSDIIESLIGQKRIASGTDVAIAHTGIGVGIRAGAGRPNISSVEAFKKTLLGSKAVAYTGDGRSGVFVVAIFERLGIAEQMKAKSIIYNADVGPKTVLDGQADFVITTFGSIYGFSGLEFVGPVPSELQVYSVVTGGIGISSKEPYAAKALLDFLTSPSAAGAIKSKGLEPNAPRT